MSTLKKWCSEKLHMKEHRQKFYDLNPLEQTLVKIQCIEELPLSERDKKRALYASMTNNWPVEDPTFIKNMIVAMSNQHNEFMRKDIMTI